MLKLEELKQGEPMALDMTRWGNYAGEQAAKVRGLPKVTGSVAVIPIYGGLEPYKYQIVASQYKRAMQSSSVGAVVLHADSPGGTVHGCAELCDLIRGFRGTKPSATVYDALGASAMFWVGSSTDKQYVVSSGDVGSVGVWGAHVDMSQAIEEMGYKVTLISAGKFKVEGNPYQPLTDEALASYQQHVDYSYESFLEGLAANFGISKAKVMSDFGEGRTLQAKPAKAAGMVHGIATLNDVVAGFKKTSQHDRRDTAMLLGAEIELKQKKRLRRARANRVA